jgi:hypothetical protein
MRSQHLLFFLIVLATTFFPPSIGYAQVGGEVQPVAKQSLKPVLPPELNPPTLWPAQFGTSLKARTSLKAAGTDASARKPHPLSATKDAIPLFVDSGSYNSAGSSATSIVAADVNGDGKPDVIVLNFCTDSDSGSCVGSGVVGAMLGNGDGTFQSAQPYGSGGYNAIQIVVADLNGDGRPDVVALNACQIDDGLCLNGSIGILLGNGDGTFRSAVTYGLGRYNPSSIVVGDINGDGKPDLIIGYYCVSATDCDSGEIDALLGNGDGTFQAPQSTSSGGYLTESIALADVNQDGKLDLVAANCGGPDCFNGTVDVLLGNGDGSFQLAQTYPSGAELASAIAVADVNGDGHPDLLVANYCSSPGAACGNGGVLSVLQGNGDGTFQAARVYLAGTQGCSNAGYCPVSIAAADVNGDGNLDVLIGPAVLPGNGDGTFGGAENFDVGGCGSGQFFLADLDGDGRVDLAMANYLGSILCEDVGVTILLNNSPRSTNTTLASSANPSSFGQIVTFTARVAAQGSTTPTGSITIKDGITVLGMVPLARRHATLSVSALSAGTHTLTASYSGDSNYQANVSGALNQSIAAVTTATAVSASAQPIPLNQPVTYTAIVSSQYGGSVTGSVAFKDGSKVVGTGVIAGNQASCRISYSAAGTHLITALYSGDVSNSASTSSVLQIYVESQPVGSKTLLTTSGSPALVGQSVSFTAAISSVYGPIPDGGTVTFYDGPTVIGSSPTLSQMASLTTSSLSAKTHTIKALYGGDATLKPSSGTVSQLVLDYFVSVVLTSSLNPSVYGQPVTLTATVASNAPGGPTGTVTFKNGSVNLGTVALTGHAAALTTTKLPSGTVAITASYNGDMRSAKSMQGMSVVVDQAWTSATMAASLNPSPSGRTVRFTAVVTSPTVAVTGSVSFIDGATVLGTANVVQGKANFSAAALKSGAHAITAVYAGTANIRGCRSSQFTQTVN